MKKQIIVLEAKPNNYATFQYLMYLGHHLQETNNNEYFVKIDVKNDLVKLFYEEN